MGFSTVMVRIFNLKVLSALVTAAFLAGCETLDHLTAPGVEGLLLAPDFTAVALTDGGIGDTGVRSTLDGRTVSPQSLQTMLTAAIRSKRPDVFVGTRGRYQVSAQVIGDDVSKRSQDIEGTTYRWAKRQVRVSYSVVDGATGRQVWGGIIATENETLATYEIQRPTKTSERVLEEIVTALTDTDPYPYPDPPAFNAVVTQNFEGFALNLPYQS
ncbi:hypothetical protein [Pelagibius sp.]|uniref:hypothetical protein n=1 Tax=Pelagibius sp. TaxID=1931238 RepID=UPI00261FE30E|nr:hypothetical protein [Pelagibius sp.]